MGLLSTLNTGVSGMSASQVAIATTGHNISNVNDESYTRQRIQTSSVYTSDTRLNVGLGVNIDNIVRLHDEFVYNKLKTSSGNKEYYSNQKQNLQEVAQYFPDLDKVGLKNDISNYFDAWNDFASNPSDAAQKVNLITATSTMTSNIQDTRERLTDVQESLNKQIKTSVDNLNTMGQSIAEINKQIQSIETLDPTVANDLRDKRDELELAISKLLNVSVFKGTEKSDSTFDMNYTESGKDYNMNIAGVSFINGGSFNPIEIDNAGNSASFYSLYSEREDEVKKDLTGLITGGKIGSLLDLRGRKFDSENPGYPTDGTVQGYIDDLDTLAKGIIVSTNNIYSQSAQDSISSSVLEGLKDDTALGDFDTSIQNGTFDVIVYDADGNEIAKKTIEVNQKTTMDDSTPITPTIVGQFNESTDDNGDNDLTNDVDDYFKASYDYNSKDKNGVLTFERTNSNIQGYSIAVVDHGTNFPGVMGLNKYFSGDSAENIQVTNELQKDPSSLNAYSAPTSGNNEVANDMIQLQYDEINFFRKNGSTTTESIEGFYRFLTTDIASDAEHANTSYDTTESLYQTVNKEFQSISGVSLDEELADLMKFQTTYSSNAKILTTIDEMLNTLLGIK